MKCRPTCQLAIRRAYVSVLTACTHSQNPENIVKVAQGLWGEAAKKMAELVNDDTFRSLEGKSKHQLWLELCDLITKHPKDVEGLKVDAILRSGIRKFTDEVRAALLLKRPLSNRTSTSRHMLEACAAAIFAFECLSTILG